MARLLRGALVLSLLLAACGDDGVVVDREEGREVGVYAAIIADVADEVELVDEAAEPADRIVYVEPLDPEEPIPLEVQVGVVTELEEDEARVVFIDDREEAILPAEDHAPVREGAALVALGPVGEGSVRVSVDAVVYEDDRREERYRYVVEWVDGAWEVAERRSIE